MKEVTPKRVLSRIRNQKLKQIYLYHETWDMLKRNADCEELKNLQFLVTFETISYKGRIRELVRLEKVNIFINGAEEDVYSSPEFPIGVTVI